MKKYKKYIRITALLTLFVSIGIMGFNIVVDPYGIWYIYDKVGFNKQRLKSNELQRINKIIISSRREPEVIFLGSSRVNLTLNPEYHKKITGKDKVYNLAINSGNIYELRRLLEHAIKISPNLQEVILGIDFFMFNENKKTDLTFDDLQIGRKSLRTKNFKVLVFSVDACKDSLKSIDSNYTNQYDYDIFSDNGKWTEKFTDKYYENQKEITAKGFVEAYRKYRIDKHSLDDLRNIVEIARENNINLKVYVSPVHALLLESIYASGSWNAYEEWKREIVKIVPVVDFTAYNFITTEDLAKSKEYFGDISHMRLKTGNWVLDRLYNNKDSVVPKDFGLLVNEKNIEAHLQNIRMQRDRWRVEHLGITEKIASFKGFILQKPNILTDKAYIVNQTVVRVDHLLGQSFQTKQAKLKKDNPLIVSGWSIAGGAVSKQAFLALKASDGSQYYAVLDKVKRQDVADTLQNNDFVEAGFVGSSYCDDVPIGKYELRLIEVNEDEQVYSAILGGIDICE